MSKALIDRVFDFRGLQSHKLKQRVIKVAAGTPIGCQTCHSITLSCKGSPAGADCGRSSEATATVTNQPPVFDRLPEATGVIGEAHSYTVHATDPDGDPVTYSISRRPDDMRIDPVAGKITTGWPPSLFYFPWESGATPSKFVYPYVVTASDDRGGFVTRRIDVKLDCPAGLAWGVKGCTRTAQGGVNITSRPEIAGLNVGDTYQYQVVATDEAGLPLTYGLIDPPTGMLIDATGLVNWTVPAGVSGEITFKVQVSNSDGGSATQPVSVMVCAPPSEWHAEHGHCM